MHIEQPVSCANRLSFLLHSSSIVGTTDARSCTGESKIEIFLFRHTFTPGTFYSSLQRWGKTKSFSSQFVLTWSIDWSSFQSFPSVHPSYFITLKVSKIKQRGTLPFWLDCIFSPTYRIDRFGLFKTRGQSITTIATLIPSHQPFRREAAFALIWAIHTPHLINPVHRQFVSTYFVFKTPNIPS